MITNTSVIQVGAIYKHFKGHVYEVIALAKHSETREDMVVYRSVDDASDVWTRPASMFLEHVEKPEHSYSGPRFLLQSP